MNTGASTATTAAPTPAPAARNKGRILVVDDDRLVLATVTHGLSQAGYEVIDADNGDDAILLAREHRPQLALLDIRMEGKSGFDVAETLRDAYRIPFMFLSAFADAATRQKVQELGAVDYLIKPLEVGQIIPAVDAALARVRGVDLPAAGADAPTAAQVLADPVPLAVGLLMHRHSLTRAEAFRRLQRLAEDQKQPLWALAEKLLGAVEELARTSI